MVGLQVKVMLAAGYDEFVVCEENNKRCLCICIVISLIVFISFSRIVCQSPWDVWMGVSGIAYYF